MQLARPSLDVARRLGINRNHHVRVWCTCGDGQGVLPPGTWAMTARPLSSILADPRRLGMWDALGYVDVREPGAAVRLWEDHVRRASHDTAA